MKRLLVLICLLQAGTVTSMDNAKQTQTSNDIPHFTYNAQATQEYYTPRPKKHLITYTDGSFVVSVQETLAENKYKAFRKENEMDINISDFKNIRLLKSNNQNDDDFFNYDYFIRIKREINRENLKDIILHFASPQEFDEFSKHVDSVLKSIEQCAELKKQTQKEQTEILKNMENKVEKMKTQVEEAEQQLQSESNSTLKRLNASEKSSFRNKLTLGFIGCGLSLGIVYLAYKQPSWIMGGIKNLLSSFNFSSIFKR